MTQSPTTRRPALLHYTLAAHSATPGRRANAVMAAHVNPVTGRPGIETTRPTAASGQDRSSAPRDTKTRKSQTTPLRADVSRVAATSPSPRRSLHPRPGIAPDLRRHEIARTRAAQHPPNDRTRSGALQSLRRPGNRSPFLRSDAAGRPRADDSAHDPAQGGRIRVCPP